MVFIEKLGSVMLYFAGGEQDNLQNKRINQGGRASS